MKLKGFGTAREASEEAAASNRFLLAIRQAEV